MEKYKAIRDLKDATLRFNNMTQSMECIVDGKIIAELSQSAINSLWEAFQTYDSASLTFTSPRLEVSVEWYNRGGFRMLKSRLGEIPLGKDFKEYIGELYAPPIEVVNVTGRKMSDDVYNVLLNLPMSSIKQCMTNEELIALIENYL